MTDRELLEMALEAMDVLLIDEKWYATKKALRARLAEPDPLPPPPECQTEGEKLAYAFGWWKALETKRMNDD